MINTRPYDTELDKQLKLRMLQIYNDRLAERAKRKAFIIDRGLLNVKRQQGLERKRTPQERDLHGRA
jgi:transcriptional adapter 2-alpha